jgi:hypothetical protein
MLAHSHCTQRYTYAHTTVRNREEGRLSGQGKKAFVPPPLVDYVIG